MRPMRTLVANLVVTLVVAIAMTPSLTRATPRPPPNPFAALESVVVPADRTSAPPNATPWIGDVNLGKLGLRADDGATIASDVETFDVDLGNGLVPAIKRIVPRADLVPGSIVHVVFNGGADELSSFTVTSERSTAPPAAPTLRSAQPDSDYARPQPLVVDIDAPGVLLFARKNALPADDGRTISMIAMPDDGAQLVIFGDPGERATINVVAVDVAGNQSAASAIDVELPKARLQSALFQGAPGEHTLFASCASTNANGDVVVVAAMAALLMRGTIRRCASSSSRRCS